LPYDLNNYLVIGVSSRALFSLEEEHAIFEKEGEKAYSDYQIKNEDIPLKPGVAFPLIKAVL
jgi:5'-nucleotidase